MSRRDFLKKRQVPRKRANFAILAVGSVYPILEERRLFAP
jgi:hypothetical protein